MKSRFPTPVLRALALAALVASAPLAHAAVDTRASRYYEDALARYEKKDLAGAIIQLKNALQIDNGMLAVHVLLGKALLENGDVAAAEAAFAEALRLGVNRAEVVVPMAQAVIAQGRQQELLREPRFAPNGLPPATQIQMLLLRAAAMADIGDPRGAMLAIEQARALDPSGPDSWLAEVPVRLRARQFVEATTAADRALSLAPALAEAHYLRGTVSHLQGHAAAALDRYAQALKLDPKHTEALVSRAGLLLDARRLDDARRDVDELKRSSPRDPRGAYLGALIAERLGQAAEARAGYLRVTELLDAVPIAYLRHRPQALLLGGLAHHALNQPEKALAYLSEVQRAQPNTGVAKLVAQIEIGMGNVDRAVEALERYLRAQPTDAQAMLLLASAHMAKGRHARATQLLQDALRMGDNPRMRTMLGLSLVGAGKFADAASAFENAFRTDPRQWQAGVALGTLYLQSGQVSDALRVTQVLVKQQPRNPGVQNLHGMVLARGGDLAGARKAFDEASRLDANFMAPQVNLARIDIAEQAFQPAARRLDDVLRRDSKNVEALLELGRLHELQGRPSDAQRTLERADEVSGPSDVQAALALVDMHLRHRQIDAARAATKRLTAKAPDALPVLLALARVDLAGGDVAAARTSLTRASSQAGYNAGALVGVALLQSSAGDLTGAAHSLDKALKERPDLLPAQALRAEIDLRQGDLAKAEQRARQIAAQHPKLGIGHSLLGDVAMARGQRTMAIETYRRAHAVEPTSASLVRLHGALEAVDATGAARLAEQWLKDHPRDVAVHRVLADGLARAGRFPAAKTAYEGLLAVAPNDAEALNNLANVLLRLGDPMALQVAERALARAPGVPHIIGTTGWAAFKAGQTDRALQMLRDARLRDPGNAETRYFLGAVLASAGRKAEAKEELEAALKLGAFPSAVEAQQLLKTLN